jgi:hypothetical protein
LIARCKGPEIRRDLTNSRDELAVRRALEPIGVDFMNGGGRNC